MILILAFLLLYICVMWRRDLIQPWIEPDALDWAGLALLLGTITFAVVTGDWKFIVLALLHGNYWARTFGNSWLDVLCATDEQKLELWESVQDRRAKPMGWCI